MAERTLMRAQAGDQDAFRDLTEPYRRELQLHCYRMLGSLQDAEDLLQETLLAAYRGLERFEGRASVRAWLYRIATNRCLNMLRERGRRPRRAPAEPAGAAHAGEAIRLEPYPDALLEGIADDSAAPDTRYEMREAVGLAFVAALEQLPPRQRAALVLRDVLGFRATEVAEILDTSELSVKGALQRGRAALRALPAATLDRAQLPSSGRERELVGRFADAVESGDIDDVVALLGDDALLTMPPQPLELRGHRAIAAFLRERADLRGAPLRVVPTGANRQPAFGCYLPDARTGIARPYGMIVLTLEREAIAAITWFDASVMRHFGLPRTLASR